MAGPPPPHTPRGWLGRAPPSPFRPASPYGPSPPPLLMRRPMSPMLVGGPPRSPGPPYIPCPRPRWPSPLPYRMPPQSPSPVMCPSPEYLYSYSPAPPYELVGYVPLEPPGPRDDEIDNASNTAAIIASQSQDYVDEKLAEYQATIQQLQGE